MKRTFTPSAPAHQHSSVLVVKKGKVGLRIGLIWLILLTSALGALPTAVRMGGLSISGLLTVGIATAAFISIVRQPCILKAAIPGLAGLSMLWLMSLAAFFGFYSSSQEGLQNYAVVWGGMIFILAVFAHPRSSTIEFVSSLSVALWAGTWIYLAILLIQIFSKGQDPATALAGITFFAYHLARLFAGKRRSGYVVIVILLGHVLLGARIVFGAEVLLLLFGRMLAEGFRWPFRLRLSRASIVSFLILAAGALTILSSGILERKFIEGDKAWNIAGVNINTSGRAYMWEQVVDSWLESPWVGHGTPGPPEMLATPRWSHPHNDYLRLLHQLGIVGLISWLIFFVLSLRRSRSAVNYHRAGSSERVVAHAAYMAAVGLAIGMLTDNAIVYSYVVYPISAMLGVAAALGPRRGYQERGVAASC